MEEDIRALWELGMATSSSGKKESQFESESQSWESVWSLICGWQIEKAQEKEKRWNVELLRQKKQISWEGQDNISIQYWQGRVVGYCCPDFLQGGVAVFFYVMTICTPVMVLILLAGKRQSKCGSTQVM